MDDFEDILIKIQKLYEQFEEDPNEEIAKTIEMKLDFLKIAMRDMYFTLSYFPRIGKKISKYLDSLEADECQLSENTNCLSGTPTVDKIGRVLGIS